MMKPNLPDIHNSVILYILHLDKEQGKLIYDFDKVAPENRATYKWIQAELTHLDIILTPLVKNLPSGWREHTSET